MTIHSDGPYVLPGGIEPYRLWFEWLKLVMRYSKANVDKKHYQAWGGITHQSFDEWFEPNWRELFGVSVVRQLQSNEKANNSDDVITLEIPKRGLKTKIIMQVQEFFNQIEDVGTFVLPEAPFMITKTYNRGFLPNIAEQRMLLRLYKLSVSLDSHDENSHLEKLAVAFVETYQNWSLAEQLAGRKVVKLPDQYRGYVQYLNERIHDPTLSIHEWNYNRGSMREELSGQECRQFVRRQWLGVKSQRDAVCKGVFPVEKPPKKRKPK